MADLRNAAQNVKSCFDRIRQAQNDPQKLQQAIDQAQQAVDQLVQQASQQ